MTNFVNLTPHAIVIKNGKVDITIPPSGYVARVKFIENVVDELDGIEVIKTEIDYIEFNVPIEENKKYIVSSMVLDAIANTKDYINYIYAPDTGKTAIRNEEGQIIAVTRLKRN